ncbi:MULTISPECIES: hypothetical protein [unclassified Rhizobium]|uniref:hypothetical protein n=1 Tax=unclassified Rhizobium TaxID=2613769 RepID=UPI000CDF4C5B|nr:MULTISPECIES: hypothetical protein [Rhizobium]AVA23113.1 hypothetical protein NXC24_CH03492 [Rhizobium sp. NXC24]UWU20472.1 hypothetical protein N2601_14440 [Rhizobium tropici]
MNAQSPTLTKEPALAPAQDFDALRREGVGYIASAGSAHWTDYNIHDPGITILESLCYAITDIGYRIDWDIADLLTRSDTASPADPYPNQPFFTARDILTVNPTTPDDFRRLLIDRPKVRNAWLTCKACACEASYFAWCENDELKLSFSAPADVTPAPREAWARGLYETLLELEDDPELGDLNDRMIVSNTVHREADQRPHPVAMELRFPDMSLLGGEPWRRFVNGDESFTVTLTWLSATKTYNLLTDATKNDDQRSAYIREHWRGIFFLSFRIDIPSPDPADPALATSIVIDHAALRVFADTTVRSAAKLAGWKTLFGDNTDQGFIARYRKKAKAAGDAVADARRVLQSHRNLDEDYCSISAVGIEEVAVCADIEVEPDADIERVQAEIWFEIEQYFGPPIRFRTLQEQRDAGVAIEDIFNGPALENGFIDAADLDAAALKTTLRGSDIINRLMEIPGLVAVNQLRLTKYDSEGNAVKGAADPSWVEGQPVFDPNKLSATWLLFVASRHQPRLYHNQSRFLFYKNGLPLRPRLDEAMDTLLQLRGDAERPKNPSTAKNLVIPKGTPRAAEDYTPMQYSLPATYGVSPAGLSSRAPPARVAQANDLKSYLMVFEQLLGNSVTQLAHGADLFSLDPGVKHTYFVKDFGSPGSEIAGMTPPSAAAVQPLLETLPEYHERRNRFLDHLLARFGEQFSEYALLLTNASGKPVAQARLIEDKIGFLTRYPAISRDRARAFDYTKAPLSPENYPGLKERISLLLGFPGLTFVLTVGALSAAGYPVDFELVDRNKRLWFKGQVTVAAADETAARQAAYRALIELMIRPQAYVISAPPAPIALALHDATSVELGRHPNEFDTPAAAEVIRGELLAWSANQRLIVVEHLLLRPKFIGDALYPACCDDGCATCGNEDSYSFRLTVVMPGWTRQYTSNLDLRRFADRTIRQETPSHLLPKICWVGSDGFVEDPCDEIVIDLADLLVSEGQIADGMSPSHEEACAAATAIYHAFSTIFVDWYDDRKFVFLDAAALNLMIGALFQTGPAPDAIASPIILAPLWEKVRTLMTAHFVEIALNGWQFERFEWAWSQWLEANAKIDWTDERLVERVEAMLAAGLTSPQPTATTTCKEARTIVTAYGTAFHEWMKFSIASGTTFDTLGTFTPPGPDLPTGMTFRSGTAEAIEELLNSRYSAYRDVSYWLWAVVTLLGRLRNIYPGATLHDCDDGSDGNPVRLDNTALGNYTRRTTL